MFKLGIFFLFIGLTSGALILLFNGAVILLGIYFHAVIKEELNRLNVQSQRNREFNLMLKEKSRLI
jgi:hypothetical protein